MRTAPTPFLYTKEIGNHLKGCLEVQGHIILVMEKNIHEILESWKKLPNEDPVSEKDYSQREESVFLTLYVSRERANLFKSFCVECPMNEQAIKDAIEKLSELKEVGFFAR